MATIKVNNSDAVFTPWICACRAELQEDMIKMNFLLVEFIICGLSIGQTKAFQAVNAKHI